MAVYFVFEDNMPVTRPIGSGEDDENPGLVWHVGEPVPQPKTRFGMPKPEVIEVQADGHELDFIREHFRNIPNVVGLDARVVRWFGETAKFIYYNLPRK